MTYTLFSQYLWKLENCHFRQWCCSAALNWLSCHFICSSDCRIHDILLPLTYKSWMKITPAKIEINQNTQWVEMNTLKPLLHRTNEKGAVSPVNSPFKPRWNECSVIYSMILWKGQKWGTLLSYSALHVNRNNAVRIGGASNKFHDNKKTGFKWKRNTDEEDKGVKVYIYAPRQTRCFNGSIPCG